MVAQGIQAGKAYISLNLFDEEAMKATERFGAQMDAMASKFGRFGTKVAALGTSMLAPFALGVRNMLQFTRALDFSARRLGVTATELSRLQIAAETFGITLEGLEIAVKTIGERLFQLRGGAGDAGRALADLGISQAEFLNAGTLDRFFMIAEGLANIEDAATRAGLGLALLGESGFAVNAFLAQGPAAIDQLRNGVRDFGVRQESIEAVSALNTEFTLLRHGLRNLAVDLATEVTPALISIGKIVSDVVIQLRLFVVENPNLVKSFAALGGVVTALGAALLTTGAAFKVLGSLGKSIVEVVTLLKSLKKIGLIATIAASGFGGIAAAIQLAIVGIVAFLSFDRTLYVMSQTFGLLAGFIGKVVEGLGHLVALVPGLGKAGEAMQEFGDGLVKGQRGRLNQTFEEFKEARREAAFGGPDSAFGGQNGGFLGSAFSSPGVTGGFAGQQTLGLANAQTTGEQVADYTRRTAEEVERQGRERNEYRNN